MHDNVESQIPTRTDSMITNTVKGPLEVDTSRQDGEDLMSTDPEGTLDTLFANAKNGLRDMKSSQLVDMLKPLKIFGDVAASIAQLNPYASIAVGVLFSASEAILKQEERDDDVKDLFSKILDVYSLVIKRKEQATDRSMGKVLMDLAQQVRVCVDFIVCYTKDKNYWLRLFESARKNTGAVIKEYNAALDDQMQRFRDQNALQTTLFVYRIADDVNLNDMEYASGVSLNTSKQCLEGTRTDILLEIKDWMSNIANDAKQIMWISGMAGKGKSAIAHTIAGWAQACGMFGSCFCFDRTREGGRLHEKIFTTIARDLADHDPLVRRALADAIRDNNELRHSTDLRRQWEQLIVGPIRAASKIVRAPILIVIDALDESGGRETREDILRVLTGGPDRLSQSTTNLPPNIRIVLTSRPLPDIESAIKGAPHIRQISLDAVTRESAEPDVKRYIASNLKPLGVFQDADFQILAQKSDGLFEWARLACSHINNQNSIGQTPIRRFQAVVAGTSAKGASLLDEIYKLVLGEVMPESERGDVLPLFRSIMGQVITCLEPLSIRALTAMRKVLPRNDSIDDEDQDENIECFLGPLGSLLAGVTDLQTPVRPLHASFYDFLTEERRSGEFHIGEPSTHHQMLAFACLSIMKVELCFNICRLESSYIPNSGVTDLPQRIENFISSQLNYSCRFWTFHVLATPIEPALADELGGFFKERVLFWLEVLSLTQSLSGPASALYSISSMFTVRPCTSTFGGHT
ncbi:uncharacterized protein FIBRA_08950 [Fibroporia radiculosa]|uniref:Nephrocystin 3-like N-terminal domain-containing protein n=1 Tax=Fibroporia radiculosa TaxID=599839 RepID=J4GXP1_9APHY|nr:uncharacterized protein FIBRA_08950 [Fibroporia radiculosa]CCM06665.1 predicted protein [Fibroporia radiculosa]